MTAVLARAASAAGAAVGRGAERLAAPAPAERLAAARLLVGGYAVVYLLARLPHLFDLAGLEPGRWRPVGVLSPLGTRPAGAGAGAVLAATLAAGVGFCSGWRWRLCGPAFAVGTLVVTTYGASFGHALHTENLLVLHLFVLAAAPAADAWSLDARAASPRRGRDPRIGPGHGCPGRCPVPAGCYGFPLRLAAVVTALTYAIAGWAKLRNGGVGWLNGDILRLQVAYDNARKVVFGDAWSPLGTALVGRAWVWPPLSWATLAVELGAPVALLRRRWAYLWAGAAWTFHLGTLAVMAILFPYPLSGVAFAPLLPLERLARRARAAAGRWATALRRASTPPRRASTPPRRAPAP